MQLNYVASKMGIELLNPSLKDWEKRDVTWGYSSDLLSFVIAEARSGYLWITKQVHINIVAVASLNELSGIVVSGKKPDAEVLEKATGENIPIFYSHDSVFETAGKLYRLMTENAGQKQ